MATLNKKVELLSDFEEVAMRKGRQEGRKESKAETARKMKADGFPLDVICKYTGLSQKEIEAL